MFFPYCLIVHFFLLVVVSLFRVLKLSFLYHFMWIYRGVSPPVQFSRPIFQSNEITLSPPLNPFFFLSRSNFYNHQRIINHYHYHYNYHYYYHHSLSTVSITSAQYRTKLDNEFIKNH